MAAFELRDVVQDGSTFYVSRWDGDGITAPRRVWDNDKTVHDSMGAAQQCRAWFVQTHLHPNGLSPNWVSSLPEWEEETR